MIKNLPKIIADFPPSAGIFNFKNSRRQSLYVGISQNIKLDVENIITTENHFLTAQDIGKIEFFESANSLLTNVYAATIQREKPLFNFPLFGQKLYPHFKITGELFPQLQITRRIEFDNSEYFGAFLPETTVRILFDFLIRNFQLRNCTIPVIGDFPVPCTQFYEKLCRAPCVANICDQKTYNEFVRLLRLFLENKQQEFESFVLGKIENASAVLDFETAKNWRDLLFGVQQIRREKRMLFRLDDAIDNFEIVKNDENFIVHLVTLRGRKHLGNRVFVFENTKNLCSNELISQILWQFYQFHAPKEIRVPIDFPNRKFLSDILSQRENRKIEIKIVPSNNIKITAKKAFGRAKFEFDFRQIKPPSDRKSLQQELKNLFKLKFTPKQIECFDVAHISGTNFVAAKSVWSNGEFSADDYQYWRDSETNELKMLQKGIENSFVEINITPKLILIDGGKPQLNAALKARKNVGQNNSFIIAAVKPPQKHNEISHFIDETGNRFEMNPQSEALHLLVRLRDEAHYFANRIHRTIRDTAHFYELAEILPNLQEKQRKFLLRKYGSNNLVKKISREELNKIFSKVQGEKPFFNLSRANNNISTAPLIVPISYNAPNGEAKDLQPLRMRKGKIL